jgi:galactokinase
MAKEPAWSVESLGDLDLVSASFVEKAFSGSAARTRAELMKAASVGLAKMGAGDEDPLSAFWIPGRIEVLGKHTDYAGGRSLLVTTERGFCFVSSPRQDSILRITDVVNNLDTEFVLHPDLLPEVGQWTNYPVTVARRLCRNFGLDRGANIAFASDLPQASGMSSSSAMIVGFALLLINVNRLDGRKAYRDNVKSAEDLAGYLGTIENGQNFGCLQGDKGVGTFGGSEDHTAMICSKANYLSQYAYCPVVFERSVPLPDDLTFIVAYSGVVAQKTGEAKHLYNRASRLAAASAKVWSQHSGAAANHLASALMVCKGDPEPIREAMSVVSHREFSSEELLDRFNHFYAESELIVPAAGDALLNRDLAEFGAQVDRSQDLGSRLLKNQVPELQSLARIARDLGAHAASSFGAGFGGSVWALADKDGINDLCSEWQARYREAYPEAKGCVCFETQAGPPAFELLNRKPA